MQTSSKYILTVKEAAGYFNIGEKKLHTFAVIPIAA